MIMEQLKGHDLLDAIRYAIHDIETLNTYFAYDQVREKGLYFYYEHSSRNAHHSEGCFQPSRYHHFLV